MPTEILSFTSRLLASYFMDKKWIRGKRAWYETHKWYVSTHQQSKTDPLQLAILPWIVFGLGFVGSLLVIHLFHSHTSILLCDFRLYGIWHRLNVTQTTYTATWKVPCCKHIFLNIPIETQSVSRRIISLVIILLSGAIIFPLESKMNRKELWLWNRY